MKLLILLTSTILISLPLVAQATVTTEKFEVAIDNFEEKIGRDLDTNEYAKMQQFLLSSVKAESSPLIKTGGRSYFGSEADIDGPTSLNMGCVQAQISPILSVKALLCLSEEGDVYRIVAFEAGALLQVNVSLVLVTIDGSKETVQRIKKGYSTRYDFDGVGSSTYWYGGVQGFYYKGKNGSKMVMAGAGFGFGGGIQFFTFPGLIISKW